MVMLSRSDTCGCHGIVLDDDMHVHLYSNNVERKIGSHDLNYGQV